MEQFPSNSQKAKATEIPSAPREKVEPVTTAKTGGRKMGLGRKFKQTFFNGTAREAGEFMVTDVVVPAIRDTIHDALQSGLERLIYGERSSTIRPRGRSSIMTAPGHVDYSRISGSQPSQAQTPQRMLSRRARAHHALDELVIPTHDEAREVLDRMYDILNRNGHVSVADLYALTDVRIEHTDNKFGWTSLKGAKSVRLRQGGFLLDLPEPESLG